MWFYSVLVLKEIKRFVTIAVNTMLKLIFKQEITFLIANLNTIISNGL
jgi:hypothetical protein